jgi:hypothetical protein
MKKAILPILVVLLLLQPAAARVIRVVSTPPETAVGGVEANQYSDLQQALDAAADGDSLLLSAGTFEAEPRVFTEELCGNCQKHRTTVTASRGFLIAGKAVHLIGAGQQQTVLRTNAGYGVLFLNSRGSSLSDLAVSGGKRDPDGNATDAAIVVKFSTVLVERVLVRDNPDRIDTLVVGIGGIFGREDAELTIRDCTIRDNGWDGIALYRGAIAYIADNTIERGRGVGIGITWDAAATLLRNRISDYWKGIGTFGASRAIVANNLVKNCLSWGIIATGTSYLDAVNNNIVHNGNCGFAIWSEECRGRLVNNIILYNGWKEEWVAPQVGVWNNGKAENFIIAYNDVWGNVKGDYENLPNLTGKDGNLSADPLFRSDEDYHLQEDSPCRHAGSPELSQGDGGVSDMGMFGGSGAR